LISRRFFLKAGLLVPAAPAIVKAENIMRVKSVQDNPVSVYSRIKWMGEPLVFDKAHSPRTIEIVRSYLARNELPPETPETGKLIAKGSGKRVSVWSQSGGFTLSNSNPNTMPILAHNSAPTFFTGGYILGKQYSLIEIKADSPYSDKQTPR
jgi:hypothetical protein